MSKNTLILLGDYYDDFIKAQVETGRFSSASEVVRTALRLLEEDEAKKAELVSELIKGEQSGFVKDFNKSSFMNDLHNKYEKK